MCIRETNVNLEWCNCNLRIELLDSSIFNDKLQNSWRNYLNTKEIVLECKEHGSIGIIIVHLFSYNSKVSLKQKSWSILTPRRGMRRKTLLAHYSANTDRSALSTYDIQKLSVWKGGGARFGPTTDVGYATKLKNKIVDLKTDWR